LTISQFCNNCKYISGNGDLFYCSKYHADLYFAPDNEFYRCDKCMGKIKSKRVKMPDKTVKPARMGG